MAQYDRMIAPRAPRRSDAQEMIPKALLRAMAGLALASLVLVSYSVWSGRAHVGTPAASTAVREKLLILEGQSAQAVTIRNTDGSVIADMPHGGFITVIQNAMARERLVHRIEGNPPIRIVEYENHRIVAEDPATGWSAELYAFGGDNKAAFERLMAQ